MDELHKRLNEHLNSFLEAFNGEIYKEIDWSRPYEVTEREDLANNLEYKTGDVTSSSYAVKAWNNRGQKILFGLKIMKGAIPDDIKIGFTEITVMLDDDADTTDDLDTEEEEDALAQEYLINLTAQLKANREKQGPEYGKCCTSCGRNDLNLNIIVNASLGKAEYLCAVCLSKNHNKSQIRKIEEIDRDIEKTEKMVTDMEEIISAYDMPSVPEGLEKFAMTPLSLYKSFQSILANLKFERMEILSNMETEEKLNIQLKHAIENQDFEKATTFRDQLNKLKNQ